MFFKSFDGKSTSPRWFVFPHESMSGGEPKAAIHLTNHGWLFSPQCNTHFTSDHIIALDHFMRALGNREVETGRVLVEVDAVNPTSVRFTYK